MDKQDPYSYSRSAQALSPPIIWINLGSKGRAGRILGVTICILVGAVGGAFGAMIPFLLFNIALAGLLGQSQPSVPLLIINGGWFFGLFGLLPGAIVGLVFGITTRPPVRIILFIAVIIMTCACELLYGYPTNVPAGLSYVFAPFAVPFISFFFVLFIKIRLGLMAPEESVETENAMNSILPKDDLGLQ
jgi:hypothetical protein